MHTQDNGTSSQFNYSTLFYGIGVVWVFTQFVMLVIEVAFVHWLNLWAFAIAWALIGIFLIGLILPLALIAQYKMGQTVTLVWPSPPQQQQQDTRPYASGTTALVIAGGVFIVITVVVFWHISTNIAPCCSATLSGLSSRVFAVSVAIFGVWLVAMVIMAYAFVRAVFSNYYKPIAKKNQ